jgi:hypothetical protein
MKKLFLTLTAVLFLAGVPLRAENPPADFRYDLNEAGDGVVIQKYLKGGDAPVVIPGTIEGYPVTEIGREAFSDSRYLSAVTIPDSVTRIGDRAFQGCSLKQLPFPKNLKKIGDGAFSECRALTVVSLPEGLASIGASAFSECRALATVSLPEGLISIGASAFSECRALATVSLPESLASIGASAFSRCVALTTVNVNPHPIQFERQDVFSNCPRLTLASRRKIQDCGYTGGW